MVRELALGVKQKTETEVPRVWQEEMHQLRILKQEAGQMKWRL
jgi:hypothetical protein